MAEKDISEKILLNINEVFADVVNVLMFGGKERIQPEALDDKLVHAQYKAEDGVLHEEERDVFKKVWADRECGIELALCGLENQTTPYKFMPARVIGYDGASYREQLLDKNVRKIIPVITIVLNFGMKRWNEPKNLKELFGKIDPEVEPFVNDYKIHVYDIAWLTDGEVDGFKSDFGRVARFFCGQRKHGKDYRPDDLTEIVYVDAVLKLLTALTGDRRYEVVAEKSEVKTMCDVAERLEQVGIEKGREEERREILELFRWLSVRGRNDDIPKAVESEDFLNALYEEFYRSKA